MKAAIILLLFISPVLLGDNFTNWFFAYHSEPRVISGKMYSADNKEFGKFTGTSSGQLDSKTQKFTEEFEYQYAPMNHTTEYVMVWTKGKDGVYRGKGEDSKGNKSSSVLTVESETVYKLKSTLPDGSIVETEGRLADGMVVHSVDTARNSKGELIGVMKYTQSPTK
ncbi:MAG: hypothetical protein ACSHYB_17875 [Roseibacillus sp.]